MMLCKRPLLEAFALYPQTVEQETKIAQGLPKLWANFRDLIGIFSQSVGPSRAIWANRVQFSLDEAVLAADQLHPRVRTLVDCGEMRGWLGRIVV